MYPFLPSRISCNPRVSRDTKKDCILSTWRWRTIIIAVNLPNWAIGRKKPEKYQGFNGIGTRDLRDTGAMLDQLSCEATYCERGHQLKKYWEIQKKSSLYLKKAVWHAQIYLVQKLNFSTLHGPSAKKTQIFPAITHNHPILVNRTSFIIP